MLTHQDVSGSCVAKSNVVLCIRLPSPCACFVRCGYRSSTPTLSFAGGCFIRDITSKIFRRHTAMVQGFCFNVWAAYARARVERREAEAKEEVARQAREEELGKLRANSDAWEARQAPGFSDEIGCK